MDKTALAHDSQFLSRVRGFSPHVSANSGLEELRAWLKWNDPNGEYDDDLTEDEAWECVANQLDHPYEEEDALQVVIRDWQNGNRRDAVTGFVRLAQGRQVRDFGQFQHLGAKQLTVFLLLVALRAS